MRKRLLYAVSKMAHDTVSREPFALPLGARIDLIDGSSSLRGRGVGYSYGDVRRAVHWVLCVNQAGMLQSISKNPQKCTIGWALVKIIFLKLAINQTKIAIIFGLLFWTKLVKFCVFLTHVTKTLPSLDKKFRKVNSYLLPPITLNI